jgi:hypothetical protein
MSVYGGEVKPETIARASVVRAKLSSQHSPIDEPRARLLERLRARQGEMEDAIFPHICSLGGPQADGDAEYEVGLRAAVAAGIDYCLTGLEHESGLAAPVPVAVLEQTRRSARHGTSIKTSIQRVIATRRLIHGFILEEAAHVGLAGNSPAMREIRSMQEAMLEQFTPTIASEHMRESERVRRSADEHRAELVQRLLAGEYGPAPELQYELDAMWHLGVIAIGPDGRKTLTGVAAHTGLALLAIARCENTVWAWMGAPLRPSLSGVEGRLGIGEAWFAIGDPARGVEGWRLTHRQAQAALLVALRRPPGVTRCSDVSLEAALLRDDGLRRSLLQRYLRPLEDLRIGGEVARATLRAYFDCQRNTSSTAQLLGVARHTVEKRLHDIETALGQPLGTCFAELEVALRLNAVTRQTQLASADSSNAD